MRADVLRETALLNGLLTLVGLATTNLLYWLLLQPALPVLTGLARLSLLVLIAESMGNLIDTGINDLGLPSSLGGLLVVAPEALNALQTAERGSGSDPSTPCMDHPYRHCASKCRRSWQLANSQAPT